MPETTARFQVALDDREAQAGLRRVEAGFARLSGTLSSRPLLAGPLAELAQVEQRTAALGRGGLLDGFGRPALAAAGQFGALDASMSGVENRLRTVGAVARGALIPALLETGSALGATGSRAAAAVAAAASLGGGWGSLAVAGVGLAGVLVGHLVPQLVQTETAVKEIGEAQEHEIVVVQRLTNRVQSLTAAYVELARAQASGAALSGQPAPGADQPGASQRVGVGFGTPGSGIRVPTRDRRGPALEEALADEATLRRREAEFTRASREFDEGKAFGPDALAQGQAASERIRAVTEAGRKATSAALLQDADLLGRDIQRERQRAVAAVQADRETLEADRQLAKQQIELRGQVLGDTEEHYGKLGALAQQQAEREIALAARATAAQRAGLSAQLAAAQERAREITAQPAFTNPFDAGHQQAKGQATELNAEVRRLQAELGDAVKAGTDERRRLEEGLARDLRTIYQKQTQEILGELATRTAAVRAALSGLADEAKAKADKTAAERPKDTTFAAADTTTFAKPTQDETEAALFAKLRGAGATPEGAAAVVRAERGGGFKGDAATAGGGVTAASGGVKREDLDDKIRRAEVADLVLKGGGTISPEEAKDVAQLPELRQQARGFGDLATGGPKEPAGRRRPSVFEPGDQIDFEGRGGRLEGPALGARFRDFEQGAAPELAPRAPADLLPPFADGGPGRGAGVAAGPDVVGAAQQGLAGLDLGPVTGALSGLTSAAQSAATAVGSLGSAATAAAGAMEAAASRAAQAGGAGGAARSPEDTYRDIKPYLRMDLSRSLQQE